MAHDEVWGALRMSALENKWNASEFSLLTKYLSVVGFSLGLQTVVLQGKRLPLWGPQSALSLPLSLFSSLWVGLSTCYSVPLITPYKYFFFFFKHMVGLNTWMNRCRIKGRNGHSLERGSSGAVEAREHLFSPRGSEKASPGLPATLPNVFMASPGWLHGH